METAGPWAHTWEETWTQHTRIDNPLRGDARAEAVFTARARLRDVLGELSGRFIINTGTHDEIMSRGGPATQWYGWQWRTWTQVDRGYLHLYHHPELDQWSRVLLRHKRAAGEHEVIREWLPFERQAINKSSTMRDAAKHHVVAEGYPNLIRFAVAVLAHATENGHTFKVAQLADQVRFLCQYAPTEAARAEALIVLLAL